MRAFLFPHSGRVAAVATLLACAGVACADGAPPMPVRVPPAYTQECAACHLAYPPGLLPAASWQRLMAGLGAHFGTDASLDDKTVQQLSSWLQANAGSGKRVSSISPPQDRITRSDWFVRKHRAIDPAVWQLPSLPYRRRARPIQRPRPAPASRPERVPAACLE